MQTVKGSTHCAHPEGLMYNVTPHFNLAGRDILVGTSYGMLNHIGVQRTLQFCKRD